MPEFKNIQNQFRDQRKAIEDAALALQKARARLSQLTAKLAGEIKGLGPKERNEKFSDLNKEREKITAEIAQLSEDAVFLKGRIQELSNEAFLEIDPAEAVTAWSDDYPILMFPLRLEVRFQKTDNQPQLWLRVYPDDCNINKNEPLLSEEELKNAQSFWIEMWKAGGIESEERGAWRSLVNSHGSGRAAWIIKQYKPGSTPPKRVHSTERVLVIVSTQVLEENEEQALARFWANYWLANGDSVKQQQSFETLMTDLGIDEDQATVVKNTTTPVNLQDEVPTGITFENVIVARLGLPAPEDFTTTQISWNQAPKAIALPDKFVAIAYSGTGKKVFQFERPVREILAVGPDPSLEQDEQIHKDDNKDLVFNEELKWMVDFDEAIEAGMATRINLTSQEAIDGFDKLFVVGLRLSSHETSGAELFERLLADHFHTKEGFGLVKQGTPTNNTEEGKSGYSWLDNADESYDQLFSRSTEAEQEGDQEIQTDGQKLAQCLGIAPEILNAVPNANAVDQIEAQAMNMALFPSTLGYFMEEMMDPLFSNHDIEATQFFFANYVSGRGPLPAIRIGRQPYGILPVSVYSRLIFPDKGSPVETHADQQSSYLAKLHRLIMKIDTTWDRLVPEVSFLGKEGNPHQILLDVLGLHANSIEFHQRYAQSIMQIYNQLNLQLGPVFAGLIATAITDRGKVILRELGFDTDELRLPILEKYFLSDPSLLQGPIIDDLPDSEEKPIRPYSTTGENYIEWLVSSTGDTVRLQDFGGNPVPQALLYLLLRHSVLLSQAKTATNLLVAHELVESNRVFFDQDFIHIQKEDTGKSKFEHLYNAYPNITGSDTLPLIHYIYQANVLNEVAESRNLKQVLDALKLLKGTPTARLERLLAEHLDCCNYRIDTWKTGLVQFKLLEQRQRNKNEQKEKSLYLGAYGWLMEVRPRKNEPSIKQLESDLDPIFNPEDNKDIFYDEANLGYIHAPSIDQAATAAILRNAYDSNKGQGSKNPFAVNLTSERVRIANSFLEGIRNGQSLSALLGYQFERGLHDRSGLGEGEADKFIYPLRRAFPLVADNLQDTATTDADITEAKESNNLSDDSGLIETIQANNVIDGLKLIQHVQKSAANSIYPFGLAKKFNLPAASELELKAITAEVNRLLEIHDAIADLVMTEQIYQIVRGNFDRANGVAEAFSKGVYPPEMESVETPRSGTVVTHRLTIHFDPAASATASPNSLSQMTPRAKTEPSINAWLAKILPDPAKIQCKVLYSTPLEQDKEIIVSQKQLGLQSIDLLFSANLDTEQSMAELDDRIMNYVRYSVSRHPYTQIFVRYMDDINTHDKSIVSFFELGSILKSLRNIFLRSEHLSPDSFGLPTDTEAEQGFIDGNQLKSRVTDLANSLTQVRNKLKTLLDGVISIAAQQTDLEVQLKPHGIDTATVDSIRNQLASDLKLYLVDPSSQNKRSILAKFEAALPSSLSSAVIQALKVSYGNYLEQYKSDFSKFDKFVEDTCALFLDAALYDNNQTGTGFIYQGIAAVYSDVFDKLDVMITRWEGKKSKFETLMGSYDPSTSEEIQFNLLQQAESLISSQSSLSLHQQASAYKSDIEGTKVAFDAVLLSLKKLKSNGDNKVTTFITSVEGIIRGTNSYDVVPFDIENNRNDLDQEKLNLILLKEDIAKSLKNETIYLTKKIETGLDLVNQASINQSNKQKIGMLLSAARSLLAEEALLLPQFTLSAKQATEVENAYQASDLLLDFVKVKEERKLPVEDWFYGVARVREKVHDLENITFLTTGFNSDELMTLRPLQFPFQDEDRWLAMKFKDDRDPADTFVVKGDKLLYTAYFAREFDKSQPICGVVLDSWNETIPVQKETTAVAFHFDQPDSEPPQTMLLMVPPSIKGYWEWNDIVQSLEETWDMARKRAVEPAMIEKTNYAQFFPTTMMAVTTSLITVATNLAINNIGLIERGSNAPQ